MRLNTGVFEIQPIYRDDNAYVWTTPPQADGIPLPQACRPIDGARLEARADSALPGANSAPGAGAQSTTAEADAARDGLAGHSYRVFSTREWDYRIRRYRDGWCTVRVEAPVAPSGVNAFRESIPPGDRLLVQRMLSQACRLPARRRSLRGHLFDLPAVVDARAAQRRRAPVDPRVYREPAGRERAESVAIVLDVSASTADAIHGRGTQTVLDRMRRLAFALADGVLRSGGRCAVLAFSSNTRAQVRFQCLRDFGDPHNVAMMWERLGRLAPGCSSRLGAAVRGATVLVAEEPSGGRRRVVLLTDGQPHDVDSHDPRYLREDLRRARKEARAFGVEVVTVAPQALRPRTQAASTA